MTGVGDRDVEIDSTVAHAARMYDYLLGGSTSFAVDREAVERAAVAVGGMGNARSDARANRAFALRVVRYLLHEAGIRQVLDLGTGIPTGVDDIGAVARRIAPDCRVVYVDNDPIVLAHAHELMRSAGDGPSAYVDGDLRKPDAILDAAAATLDLNQPVGIILAAVLHLIPDNDDPYGIVARLVDAVAPGSHLAISHLTADIQPAVMGELADRLNEHARETFVLRDRDGVARFFDGLDLLDPGVVQIDHWHPSEAAAWPGGWVPSLYGAIGWKPPP